MKTVISDRLDAQRISVVRQLHDVPPHEVYELTVDGQRAVYKVTTGPTGNAGIEGRVIEFVGRQSSVPVPEILTLGSDYYVARWHPAAPDPEDPQGLDTNWAATAGRGLATLHTETAPVLEQYGRFQPQNGDIAVQGHDEWHDAALAYLRHHRPVLERYGHADMADRVIDYLTDNPDLCSGAGSAVCCHGWATPAHVSVVDDSVACLVDFEHAIAAPAEFDFWRTVLPTFGSADTDARRAFRAGYESVRPLPEGHSRRKPLYRLLNGIYYFESLYVQDQHDPDETERRAQAFRDCITEICRS